MNVTAVGSVSVGLKDCRVDHFRSGGNGGQNQNKRDTGTRIVHEPSGAVGESREHRTQLLNKKAAFKRMVETPRFRSWMYAAAYDAMGRPSVEDVVDQQMDPNNIAVQVRQNGKWMDVSGVIDSFTDDEGES